MHLGDILVGSGVVTPEQLEQALAYQKQIGGHLGHILAKLGFVTEDHLVEVLSEQMQIPRFDLVGFEPDPSLVGLVPFELLERHNAVPIKKEMGAVILGVSDPTDYSALDELRLHFGGNVETKLVAPTKARDALNLCRRIQKAETEGDDEESGASRRHRRGRKGLSDLVYSLERDAMIKEAGVKASQRVALPALDDFTSRDLILGLIRVLENNGVLRTAEVAEAIRLAKDSSAEGAAAGGSQP